MTDRAGRRGGRAGAQAEARGVEGEPAALLRAGDGVGQNLEARHEGAGERDARQAAEQGRRPQIAREEGEAEAGRDAERGRGEIDRARIAPVGPGHENGNGHDIADVERALDDADLRIAQRPGELQFRKQGGDGAVARHVQRFRKTQDQGQTPGRHPSPHAIRRCSVSVFLIVAEQSQCRIHALTPSLRRQRRSFGSVRFCAFLPLP